MFETRRFFFKLFFITNIHFTKYSSDQIPALVLRNGFEKEKNMVTFTAVATHTLYYYVAC